MNSLVARLVTRYHVALRYKSAAQLGMGNTLQTETLRVHRFRDSIRVTDLTNAGRRGKAVEEFHVSPSYSVGGTRERDAWLDETAAAFAGLVPRGYAALLKYIQDQDPGAVEFNTRTLRGVDVEPFGDVFEFKIPLRGKGHIAVMSSPLDFRVTDHQAIGHDSDDTPGFFQDTNYWPRKKKDAATFYAWMKSNHEHARRFVSLNMFVETWDALRIQYDSH